MTKVLLITPPFVQPNCPYPATAYLKGFLGRNGVEAEQYDLSVELLNGIFSPDFLKLIFEEYEKKREAAPGHNGAHRNQSETQAPQINHDINCACAANIERIYSLRNKYISTINTVMMFLRGGDPTLANLICMPEFIPQAGRFGTMGDIGEAFGSMGIQDCAKYICTFYLQDISDFIRETVTPFFEIIKYGEKLSASVQSFGILEEELFKEPNIIEIKMLELLDRQINGTLPEFIGFTIPFPGNLLSALKCAQYIKQAHPGIKIIAGGGYPTTELRSMTDAGIYKYFDHIILDDGEPEFIRIIGLNTENDDTAKAIGLETPGEHKAGENHITHLERGCPDFSGLPHGKYFSMLEIANPMHRLWSDGRWNKITLAHGCYWGKCAFCDTSLDYICRYDANVPAETLVDWMEAISVQTGSYGFHFTDEAAPPRLLRDISLEIIKRGLNFTWWTNIRFEKAFTGDLCRLMAAAGCIAVSGGLEAASDRLLEMINKGVNIETATIAMRNFYYSGIMVHTYLMYGLPTQTLQETVDSLEIVRQMFKAELIDSAFWHRYAMTAHSPSGQNPEAFGVRRKGHGQNPFANNEIYFAEDRGYNINIAGDALRLSLANYMNGAGIDRAAHKWFACKAPQTTVENSVITDHLIKPDSSRIFDEGARVIWTGTALPVKTNEGLLLNNPSKQKIVTLKPHLSDFIIAACSLCSDLDKIVKISEIHDVFKEYSDESFAAFYLSKKWDIMREYGLLQI